jgi:hypothetical protein
LIGNRANINCDVFDSGYGGCLINGADLRAAINACLGGPCNAQVIRATLRVSYQSFAGAGIINPFDSTPQSGQGDADNYCYIVDAKKNPNYAELKEVDKRFALFIVRCFEGNSLMEIDCEPTTEPIKLFGKASAWPLDSAHTGRIKVTLMAATYIITAIPPSYYRSPINFDFTADSYGWIGTGWLAGIGITPFFNTQFPHALYITGGIHTVTTIGAEGIYGQYAISPGFNCYTGGSAPITEVSPAEVTGPDSNGNFTKVQHLSIGDGFYGVGIGGTLGRCRSLNIG